MKITELIKELSEQLSLHGDVEVEICASYDDGYGEAGGKNQEINMRKATRYRDENGNWCDEQYDALTLYNYY